MFVCSCGKVSLPSPTVCPWTHRDSLPVSARIKGVPHHTWPCALFLKCSNYSFIKILKVIFIVSNCILSIFVVFFFKTKGQDIFQRSILGHILPEAMVCYLENYEPEKFSEIFLGEFDTPEAIWSSEMRWIILTYVYASNVCCWSPGLISIARSILIVSVCSRSTDRFWQDLKLLLFS